MSREFYIINLDEVSNPVNYDRISGHNFYRPHLSISTAMQKMIDEADVTLQLLVSRDADDDTVCLSHPLYGKWWWPARCVKHVHTSSSMVNTSTPELENPFSFLSLEDLHAGVVYQAYNSAMRFKGYFAVMCGGYILIDKVQDVIIYSSSEGDLLSGFRFVEEPFRYLNISIE